MSGRGWLHSWDQRGWLWLTRPEGWEAELDSMYKEAVQKARAHPRHTTKDPGTNALKLTNSAQLMLDALYDAGVPSSDPARGSASDSES